MSAAGGPRSILAIDTATDAPGVALAEGGRTRVRPIAWRAAFREAGPAAAALLAEAGLAVEGLGALAVPAGPGSFTGLRVGAALALAIARARGTALHAVPTLEAVAEAYGPPGAERVCALLDARRGRWYAALYERREGGWRLAAGPADLEPDAVGAFAAGAPRVGLLAGGAGPGPAPVAAALAALVARDPERTLAPAPGRLELVYARSGVGR